LDHAEELVGVVDEKMSPVVSPPTHSADVGQSNAIGATPLSAFVQTGMLEFGLVE
jgi:hypothetical protein